MIAPPPTLESLRAHRDQILRLAQKYGIYDVRVFGSLVHGDARPGSDVDLLVKLEDGRTLFDHSGFAYEATELLGRNVDVVEDSTLHQLIRDEVLAEAVPL
jgi:uncharacterized protein